MKQGWYRNIKRTLRNIPGYRIAVCVKDNGIHGTWQQEMRRHRLRTVCPAPGLPPEQEAPEALLLSQAADVCGVTVGVAADLRGEGAAETVHALLNQTHRDWTLYAAVENSEQERRVLHAARGDRRVRCVRVGPAFTSGQALAAALDVPETPLLAVLEPGTVLHPCALWYAVREDAPLVFTDGVENGCLLCKPEYTPDTLRSRNDLNGWLMFRRALYEEGDACGGMYGLALRLTERAQRVARVPHALYRAQGTLPDEEESRAALSAHLARCGLSGVPVPLGGGLWRTEYELAAQPLVSILIPNRDQAEVLRRCVTSVLQRSSYQKYEIVILENGSVQPETFRLYDELRGQGVRVEAYEEDVPFNYARINNWGARRARGEVLVFLNNDMEVIAPEWLEELLMFVQRPDVGAVGALLWYPDDTVQHAGIVVGAAGAASHIHKFVKRGEAGWLGCLRCARNVSAVTGACLMVRRKAFETVEGFDESFAIAFNDVDLCLRLIDAGMRNVFTPFAQLYHYESVSRGSDERPENRARFASEVGRFRTRWKRYFEEGDPCYSPCLNRADERVFVVRGKVGFIGF